MVSIDVGKRIKKENIKLGFGTYGEVFVGKLTGSNSNLSYAIKKIKFQSRKEGIPPNAIREIGLLRNFNHENIIKLADVIFSHKDKVYLVFELAQEDLRKLLDNAKETLSIRHIADILKQILSATHYCHNNFIMHRDLKPQNILIMPNGTIKVADFGLSRVYCFTNKSMTHEIVTLWYRAPEVLLGLNEYNFGVDIWSIGCIFAELFTHRPLFKGASEIDQLFKIFKLRGTPTPLSWQSATSLANYNYNFPKWEAVFPVIDSTRMTPAGNILLAEMLSLNPDTRVSTKECLEHPFFADF